MANLAIKVQPQEFDDLFNHINTHKPIYKNMHLREAKIKNKKRCLRYLHMIRVQSKSVLEGAISGPDIEVNYELHCIWPSKIERWRKSSTELLRSETRYCPQNKQTFVC